MRGLRGVVGGRGGGGGGGGVKSILYVHISVNENGVLVVDATDKGLSDRRVLVKIIDLTGFSFFIYFLFTFH